MRIRRKPNLIPRMERCSHVLICDPPALRGAWLESKPQLTRLWVELGCGKGSFTAETAAQNPDAYLVAIEKVPDAMVMAMECACRNDLQNVSFIDTDAVCLPLVFSENEVDRIFINFCDPWPKSRDAKHRLTSPGFLKLYADILKPEGELHFKTDNSPLFEYSLLQFQEQGWTVSQVTRNLHENGIQGVMTDYEAKFHAQGVPINRLVAKKDG